MEKSLLPFLLFSFLLPFVTPNNVPEAYMERLLHDLDEGQKCREGFITVPNRVKIAAMTCSNMKYFVSYLCFVICVHREYEYIVKHEDGQIDHAMGDIVTQEAYDLTTRKSRIDYFEAALERYRCAETHTLKKIVRFPHEYDNGDRCEATRPFFQCLVKAMTCGQYDVAEEMYV